jgi:glycosyltransferase involved in cell wall biosynthesis
MAIFERFRTLSRSAAIDTAVPFFENADSDRTVSRRLLLISYHFPPGVTAGALRWQKLSCYAVERGWGMDVITLHPDSLPELDDRRLTELPPGIRVYGVHLVHSWLKRTEDTIWKLYRRLTPGRGDPPATAMADARCPTMSTSKATVPLSLSAIDAQSQRRLRKVLGCLRRAYNAWIYYHEQRIWATKAAAMGIQVVDTHRHKIIISCGPPHMAHEAARLISKRTDRPFVIDLRDPWRLIERLATNIESPIWHWLAQYYERRSITAATLIVMNTRPAQLAMRSTYPAKHDRIIAVMNGYDEEPLPMSKCKKRFIIAYAGTVYLDRDPRLLFKAIARIVKDMQLTPDDISIEFMGHLNSYNEESLQYVGIAEGIEGYIKIYPPGPRQAALTFLSRAAVLLSLPQDSHMAIPSKIFEYMQFDAWILAIADRDSATELLLRDIDADVVPTDDINALISVLTARFQQFRSGQRPQKLSTNISFSRREQGRLLFDAIDTSLQVQH